MDQLDVCSLVFTAVRDVRRNEISGLQLLVSNGKETWKGDLLKPIQFLELLLCTHVLPPRIAEGLFERIDKQGQITETNVAMSEAQMKLLRLRRVTNQA